MEIWRGSSPPYKARCRRRWEPRSPWSTRRQHHRNSGRSGTTCSDVRTPSTSARTTRRNTCGSSTTTPRIYKFTNDGKQLVQTIGTRESRADGTHFNRPTFIAWIPDGSFYVADGYNGTRVAKFDAQGKFLLDFGKAGESGKETRPGYMNNVHGVAVDIPTGRVFVNDRDNHRIQIFDADGRYLSEWKIAVSPSSLHSCRSARIAQWRLSIAIPTDAEVRPRGFTVSC